MKSSKLTLYIVGILILVFAVVLVFFTRSTGSMDSSILSVDGVNMESSVAIFNPDSSVANSMLWVAKNPSSDNWDGYTSGTTRSIIAIAANAKKIIAFNGSGFIISESQGGAFNAVPFKGSQISSATIVAGDKGFVLYSLIDKQMLFISNAGQVTQINNFPQPITDITNISYFDGVFYAYTKNSLVFKSDDGISWSELTGKNIRPYTNVVELSDGLFAAMVAPVGNNPNLWLGTSPTSFNLTGLNNFFNVPAQVNFIASGGGYLYINETVFATNRTIRIYKIFNASQINTGALIGSLEIPGTSNYVKPTDVFVTPSTVYVPTGTTIKASGNDIDPHGDTTLTAAPNILSPAMTTGLVGSQSQTLGGLYAIHDADLLVAPQNESTNNGDLTLIKNAVVPAYPVYQILPSGISTTYATLVGSSSNFLVLFNNGGVLRFNESMFVPVTAIADIPPSGGSAAILRILSAGYLNKSGYLVQATRFKNDSSSNLFFSGDNGNSWGIIFESTIIAKKLGSLTQNSISIDKVSGLFNITTRNSKNQLTTYQTNNPTDLSTWMKTLTPTPLISANDVEYSFYPNSNNVGKVSKNVSKLCENINKLCDNSNGLSNNTNDVCDNISKLYESIGKINVSSRKLYESALISNTNALYHDTRKLCHSTDKVTNNNVKLCQNTDKFCGKDGKLSNSEYIIMKNTLPQNYLTTGNIAVNNSGMIALAQGATVVKVVGKVAGSNYLWTSSINKDAWLWASSINGDTWLFADNWVLNPVTFSNSTGVLPNENFNVNPVLLWNGSIWITRGNGNQLMENTAPTSVYLSKDAIHWRAATESGTLITGVPVLF